MLVLSEVPFVSQTRIVPYLRHCSHLLLLVVVAAQTIGAEVNDASGAGTSTGAPDSISGQVTNATTGLPVARALVRFNDRAVLTDHDGNFHFAQNTEASGNIMIVKPGFYATADPSDSQNLYLQAGQLQAPLKLLLYPEALLTGTVVAPDGVPLPQIPVRARRTVFSQGERGVTTAAQVLTDSHGRFRMTVPGGEYRVETVYVSRNMATGLTLLPVSFPQYNSSNTFRIKYGEEQHFDLRPSVGRTHTVSINTDSSGLGNGFVRLSVRSSSGSSFQVSPMPNRSPGEMKVELPPGTYTLLATKNSQQEPELAEATVTVADRDVSGVALRFLPYPAIPAEMIVDGSTTSDNSQPTLQQFNLTLLRDQTEVDDGSATMRMTTQPGRGPSFVTPPGTYRLQASGNGEWFVKSVSYGSSDLLQQNLVVAPGSAGTPIRVLVSNQTGAVQGTVKLNGNGAACWVYLIPTGPSAEPVIMLRSNAEGAYSSAHLPPGGYQAIAFERRYSANYRDPEILAPFATHVGSTTINSGDKAMLDLDAVTSAEMGP
jgi:hypothetical protein